MIFRFMIIAILWLAVSSCGKDNPNGTVTAHPPLDTTLNTRITGYVKYMDNRPVPNARVWVYRQVDYPNFASTTLLQTYTDNNGYYQIGFNAELASNIRYFIYGGIANYKSYSPPLVIKDSVYNKDFWLCPSSTLKVEFRNEPAIVCDTFSYILHYPAGCFEQLSGSRYLQTVGFREGAFETRQPFSTSTNSGGYAKYTAKHYLRSQLVSTRVDSVYMNPNATSTVYIPY